MREAFLNTLLEEAKRNPKIYLLTADLGYTVFERFQEEFPDRFINVGVAEAHMISCAAGLAMGGLIPVVYSIANFAVLRPFEQIRNDVCFPNHPVKIVGVGAGFAYGHAGFSHHSTEDIALTRSMPNMTVLCPSGPLETAACTKEMLMRPEPVYLRLSKKGEPDLVKDFTDFEIGKATLVRDGTDVVFFSCGMILDQVLECADLLSKTYRIEASVVNVHTVQPLDRKMILTQGAKTKHVISAEEHGITGGLGSAIAEVLAEEGESGIRLMRCGIEDKFCTVTGDRNYLLEKSGLAPHRLQERVLEFLRRPQGSLR